MKTLLKKIKFWVQGRVLHKPTLTTSQKWIGNQYGGFYVHIDALNAQSIVYSIGIGEDVSFDQELIKTIGCPVFGYDPTPKSIAWVSKNVNDQQFKFFDFGIAKVSGKQSFYLPENKNFVSGSIKPIKGVNKQNKLALQFKTLKAAMELNNHTQIDLLKMDIEGAEYEVIDHFLKHKIPIKQFVVEFHPHMEKDGKIKTKKAIKLLENAGFRCFAVSETFLEYSFIR